MFILADDGTLDTVLECTECGESVRFSMEYASHWRDEDTGVLTDEGLAQLAEEAAEDHECGEAEAEDAD